MAASEHRVCYKFSVLTLCLTVCSWRTEDGAVFSWGYPQHGRLGHSFAVEAPEAEQDMLARCVWRPQQLDLMAGARILNLSLGNDHTILLASDGRLFRCAPISGVHD